MAETRKRTIVAVSDKWTDAWQMLRYLKHHGIDAKKVSKHSLQVVPEHEQQAKKLMEKYRWDWKEK
jgi:hypothetical protein